MTNQVRSHQVLLQWGPSGIWH